MRWDIFCKIVDNFGDIGVCWRLAKQLKHEHGVQVRLFIDDFAVAKKIIPALQLHQSAQLVDGVEIQHFTDNLSSPAEVVIETFACGLPEAYLQQMVLKKSRWINLDYLSAEAWVGDFHAQPSPHPTLPITRYFFFPGFKKNTGGLIREKTATAHLDCINANHQANKPIKISLFTYPHAPIADLLTALQTSKQATLLYVPASNILPLVADFFGKKTLNEHEVISSGNLTCHVLPFLSQADYDQLLRQCDLNFVRGEDSWIRAIWAGKPFIWLPYWQTENTHFTKLNAFLDVFYENFSQKKIVCKAHQYWATEHVSFNPWQAYLNTLPALSAFTASVTQTLASQTDLATKLVIFSEKIAKNQV